MIIVNLLNILALLIYIMTVIRFYNNYTDFFFAMLIIIIYWTQLLISSTYIEMGVYLKDIGKFSYTTGATIRLFLMIELMLILIMFFAKRFFKLKAADESRKNNSIKNYRVVLILLSLMYTYRFADVMISGNIFTNPYVTRFNYFSDFSTLPIAQIIDYFSYPCLWILGYLFTLEGTRKQKLYSVLLFVMNMFTVLLRGVEFGGFLQCTLYFSGPILLMLAKKRKLIKLKYAFVAVALVLAMLVPKYNHFSEAIKSGHADTSYGLNSAYDFLLYRMFAQEADLTWEIDRQIWEEGRIEPYRFVEVIKEVSGFKAAENSTQYLMNRGCSSNALLIYSYGTAAVTGGYPILWAALFGYILMIPFLIIDSFFMFLVIRCICEGIAKQRLFLLLSGGYLLCQIYTVVLSGNLSIYGNTIPQIFIILLLLFYKKGGKLVIGDYKFKL